ncbi:hypothetical protein BJX99DRAFT_262482 [Aspergillus californicus]
MGVTGLRLIEGLLARDSLVVGEIADGAMDAVWDAAGGLAEYRKSCVGIAIGVMGLPRAEAIEEVLDEGRGGCVSRTFDATDVGRDGAGDAIWGEGRPSSWTGISAITDGARYEATEEARDGVTEGARDEATEGVLYILVVSALLVLKGDGDGIRCDTG